MSILNYNAIYNKLISFFNKNRYYILYLISSFVFITIFLDTINILIDDPYISARYAKNLINGYGLVYNPGEEPVEGFSNPLFTLIIALNYFLLRIWGLNFIIDSLYFIKFLSGIFHLLCIAVLIKLSIIFFQDDFLKTAFISLLFAGNLFLGLNVAIGLETAQHLLIILLIFLILFKDELKSKKIYKIYFGILLGLLSISRPESILFIILMIIFSIYLKNFQVFKISYLFFLIIYLSYLSFRIIYYKDIFPNTFYAKMQVFSFGYGLRYLLAGIYSYIAPVFIFLINKKYNINSSFAFYSMILFIFCQIAVIIFVAGDWIPGFRFIIPIFPLLLYLALSFKEKLSVSPYGILIFIVLLSGYTFSQRYHIRTGILYKSGLKQISVDENPYIQTANYLKKTIRDKEFSKTIAIYEAGIIPFLVNQKFLDISSLNDKHLSRIEALHFEKVDNDYIFSKKPDYIVLFGTLKIHNNDFNQVQTALFNDPRLFEEYFVEAKITNHFIVFKRKNNY